MDKLGHFVQLLESRKLLHAKLRGAFHVLVGRKIFDASGAEVSGGATWREVATLFKDLRIDPRLIVQLGLDPAVVSPRDRGRCWYAAIAAARPDSAEARAEAEQVIASLTPLGYRFGPAPAASKPSLSSPPAPAVEPAEEPAAKPKKRKPGEPEA